MKRSEGLAYLNKDGDFGVPCSRYGRSTSECAPVAWRLAYIITRETGETLDEGHLFYAMGLVVNNHDDVAYMVNTYGRGHYR